MPSQPTTADQALDTLRALSRFALNTSPEFNKVALVGHLSGTWPLFAAGNADIAVVDMVKAFAEAVPRQYDIDLVLAQELDDLAAELRSRFEETVRVACRWAGRPPGSG